ncbi:MAG TPA: long-chain fatty acid--CoA ligase [Candidatus Dormibacteraeota bacterium]|nr:long-chain fatty acid--CoA ligase [Candidatus Dormibacteraeota bacterium]
MSIELGRRSASAPDRTAVEPRVATVPEMFQRTVERRALQPAMMFKAGGKWNSIGWEPYAQGVKRIAGFLMSEGFEHGDRGAILSYNRPEWHIADLAIQHTGGCVVGIYLTNSPGQCQYIVDHAEAPVVFVENREQLAKILQVRRDLPRLRRVVLITGELKTGDGDLVTTWEKALQLGDAWNNSHAEVFEQRWRAVRPGDMATFIYTSGTTGPPKAVMLDHANICWTCESLISCTTLTDPDEDCMISYLPLAHIAERMAGHMLNVYNGHRLYFAEDLARLGSNVRDARPTFMFGVPRIWEKYQAGIEGKLKGGGLKGAIGRWAVRQGEKAVDDRTAGRDPGRAYHLADRLALAKLREALGLDRARGLSTGAAPTSEKTLRFFWAIGLNLYEVYGQSEGCGPTSTNREAYARLGSVGPAIPGVEIRIADDGEVLVKGGNVFRGYFKDPQTTAATLDGAGWLHSGDVGQIDADGYLHITDRKKDLIITAGGKNISPSNIELALKRQPYVGSVVAIGDKRPFMSCLLTIDPEQIGALAAEVDAEPDAAQLSENLKVHGIFQRGVDAINQNLSSVERIKKFTILPADLSVDGGELTPTLKVKRKVVNEKYAKQIEAIYAG